MRLLWINLLFIRSEVLYINVLYEKLVQPELEPLYKDIITSILDRYNEYLVHAGIEIKIHDALSYTMYSQDPDYKDLQKYSGTDNLSDRMSVLVNKNKNILLIASSHVDQSDIHYNLEVPCLTKYITTFSNNSNVDEDTVSAIDGAIVRYLREMLKVDIPKPFGVVNLGKVKSFVDNVIKSDFKNRLSVCVKRNKILETNTDFKEQFQKLGGDIPEVIDFPIIRTPDNTDLLDEDKIVINENRNEEVIPDSINKELNILKNDATIEDIVQKERVNKRTTSSISNPKRRKKSKFQHLTRPKKQRN